MRYLLIAVLQIFLISCSTTMPRAPNANSTAVEDASSVRCKQSMSGVTAGALLGALLGCTAGNIAGALLGASTQTEHFTVITRKYYNIIPDKVYDHLIDTLNISKFNLVSSNRDDGVLIFRYERGIVKNILMWNWEQFYYAKYMLHPSVDDHAILIFNYYFWVEEKPPLSNEYIIVECDDNAEKMKNILLKNIDKYISSVGGRY